MPGGSAGSVARAGAPQGSGRRSVVVNWPTTEKVLVPVTMKPSVPLAVTVPAELLPSPQRIRALYVPDGDVLSVKVARAPARLEQANERRAERINVIKKLR